MGSFSVYASVLAVNISRIRDALELIESTIKQPLTESQRISLLVLRNDYIDRLKSCTRELALELGI